MTEIEKKEIEKMAEVIKTKFSCMIQGNFCDRFFQCKDCPHNNEYSESIATALRNAHYRLESEVVKEFVKKCGKDFAILLDAWGNEAQRNALDKAWKTINEVAEQYGAGEDK